MKIKQLEEKINEFWETKDKPKFSTNKKFKRSVNMSLLTC